jgi:hypothetical protein
MEDPEQGCSLGGSICNCVLLATGELAVAFEETNTAGVVNVHPDISYCGPGQINVTTFENAKRKSFFRVLARDCINDF